ncbi:MAG TPA: AsmA family protein [Stellaceae bacterium]|nr:AsmA family protein [Stellaceae bacterium]
MRKAAIFFAILVVLVVAALGLAPPFVDFEHFKGPIVAELAKRTGRKVELLGPISVTLLPRPALTARDVRLANPPDAAAPDMLRLRALEVKPALLPLLRGRFEIASATLLEPELDIERLPDGTPNWRPPAAAPPARTAGAAPSGGSPPGSAFAGFAVDRVSIQNGAIIDRTRGTAERFEHINARIAVDPASGHAAAQGSLVARGAEVGFEIDSGRLDAAELPLHLTVITVPTAKLELDARLTGPLDDRHVTGQVKLSADDARSALSTFARYAAPAVAAQPLALSADIDGTLQRLVLDHLKLDLGPAHGEGRLQVERSATPVVNLALSFSSLDLDHWPMPRRAASALSLIAGAEAATPPPAATESLPDITAKIQLGADTMLWRGGLIRDARLAFILMDRRISVSRLAASLPGGADVTLSGVLTPAAAGPSAQGMIEAKADDLRGLLAWLGTSADTVPADRLRQAALSSRFTLAGNRIDLGPVDATVDGTRLGGAATVLLRARPGLGIRVVADRLNLDAYLPVPVAAPERSGATVGDAKNQAPATSAAHLLDAFDANMDARVEVLTWRGQPLRDVHLAGSLQTGELSVRELSVANAGGANATLSGVVDGITTKPSGQLAFDMRGPEFERALRLVAPSLAAGRSYGSFNMGGGLQYDGAKVTLDAELQLLDGHVRLAGEVGETSSALDLTLDADDPSFQRLVQSFDPFYQAAGGDPGPIKLSAHVTGDRHHLKVEPLALAIGESSLDGTLGIELGAGRPHLAANLNIGDWALDRLLPVRQSAALEGASFAGTGIVLAQARLAPPILGESWSAAPIDLGAMSLADLDLTLAGHSLSYGRLRLDQPALQASLSDGKLTVQRLTGSLFGGSLEASGSADQTLALAGHVAIANADLKEALVDAASLALVDGRFDVDATLAASGKSPAELVAHLSGKGTLKGHDGSIGGVDLKAVDDELKAHPADLFTLLKSAGGGRTAFSTLGGDVAVADGVAKSDDIRLVADGGDVQAMLDLNLPQWTMMGQVAFRPAAIPDAPPLVMRLEGPIDQPRTVFEVNALEQYLAQRQPDAKTPARP